MDRLSVKNQAVCTNFSYLKGEELKLSQKNTTSLTPSRSLLDPHATMLSYNLLGSLSTALSYQQNFLPPWEVEKKKRKTRKKEDEEKGGKTKTSNKDACVLQEEPVVANEADTAEKAEEIREEPVPFSKGTHPLLEKLVVTCDEDFFNEIALLFQKVPDAILSRCVEFGSKLYVLEKGKKLWPALASLSPSQLDLPGGYVPHLKASYLHKEAMALPSMQNLPLILMAHMYDHAQGGDNFSSLKSPAVYSLYLACRQRKPGHQFLSGYSEAGPVQYFAQSMASYFSPDHYRYKLFTREIFKTIDPSMYEYMTCLFGPLSK
jgi:hypothetical protein